MKITQDAFHRGKGGRGIVQKPETHARNWGGGGKKVAETFINQGNSGVTSGQDLEEKKREKPFCDMNGQQIQRAPGKNSLFSHQA